MNIVPENPKIYHLTHHSNLRGILNSSVILSDAQRIHQAPNHINVGISEIKRRRLEELEVHCHPGTRVGEYVPFYFCTRSIMLFLIYKGNHPDLTYTDGQNSIIYLKADLKQVVAWAQNAGRRWAFSDVNAGARYAFFYSDLNKLDKINWDAVNAQDFRDPMVKDRKQAEFLLYESFPIDLIESIGVQNSQMEEMVGEIISKSHQEIMVIRKPEWYF